MQTYPVVKLYPLHFLLDLSLYYCYTINMVFPIKYTLTPSTLNRLDEISGLREILTRSQVTVSWIPQLGRDAASRIAHASTAIEGNPLTLREVTIVSDGGEIPTRSVKQKQEIVNYLAALRYIVTHAKDLPTVSDILELHSIVGKEYVFELGLGGVFRSEPVAAGKHIAPKATEVPQLVNSMLEWLEEKGKDLPAVIPSAVIHYVFAYIHPFMDGNGRVGRLLADWILYRLAFDRYHIFSVDEFFLQNRDRYYEELQKADESDGVLTTWIEYVAEAVLVTLQNLEKRITALSLDPTLKIELTPNQEKLLHALKVGPMNIREIMEELGVTKSGAHFIISPLIKRNRIEKAGGWKTGKYRLTQNVSMINKKKNNRITLQNKAEKKRS